VNLYLGLETIEIAEQIAYLLNSYNQLAQKRDAQNIVEGNIGYVVELHGKHVIAACGMEKQSHVISELKHLVVRPEWRGKGVARHVARRALEVCQTPFTYATVRVDNESSLKTLLGLGFSKNGSYKTETRTIELLTRINPKWQAPKIPDWMSGSWLEKTAETNFKPE